MPDYPFTVFSFLGVLLCIEPAYFNWRVPGRPWSARIFVGWVFIYNLLSFIDSIVWASETLADWPDGNGYCDIGARIKTAFPIGVLGSTICLCLFLINSTNLAPSQKDMGPSNGIKRNMFDMFLGMVLPVIFVVLHFIVEPTQYGILGVAGCQSTTDTAWPTIILYSIWPTLMTFIALILFAIFLHRLSLRRGQLHENWGIDMPTGISKNGFYRLLITVLFTIAISLPYSLYNLIEFLVSRTNPPSYSWDRIHGSWSIIVKISLPSAPWLSWIAIVLSGTAILFLALNSSDIRRSIKIRIERRKARRAGHTSGDPKLELHRKTSLLTNWHDCDDDTLDAKSLPSSETTLRFRDEEDLSGRLSQMDLDHPFSPTIKTEVSSGSHDGQKVRWNHGVTVTRQVVVETSTA